MGALWGDVGELRLWGRRTRARRDNDEYDSGGVE
jgi:hypothetical protein